MLPTLISSSVSITTSSPSPTTSLTFTDNNQPTDLHQLVEAACWLCHDNCSPSQGNMTKDDWIKLAMPASITLLATAIFTMPFVVQASQTIRIQGTGGYPQPIEVKIVK